MIAAETPAGECSFDAATGCDDGAGYCIECLSCHTHCRCRQAKQPAWMKTPARAGMTPQ